MPHERVFVHGSGRRGIEAWPEKDASAGEFLGLTQGLSIADQVSALRSRCERRRVIVFAHSIGAIPAVIAARDLDLAALVLIEPALYDIARGDAAVERHIGIVTEARSVAEAGDLPGFWAIMRPLMFGGHFDGALWDEERALAARWACTNLPWGHGARAQMVDGIPTLVVTGGWNDEYEQIARVLRDRGARHEIVPGHGHRPQDSSRFTDVVGAFESTLFPG
ncbi:alpha/beta hydrolase [Microbacterium sp. UFMG61]|uniref:alpha/beta hydrolase n=1 Tax=Microbacterium sp. UFMG61 TaxID=2745935 RepID=UPI00188F9C9A|nr:alpha/beta hydrolase [Microbacterium sp. UFMG61]